MCLYFFIDNHSQDLADIEPSLTTTLEFQRWFQDFISDVLSSTPGEGLGDDSLMNYLAREDEEEDDLLPPPPKRPRQ